MPTALLFGATGLVGGELVKLLATDGRWDRVVTPARRPVPRVGPRHEPVVVDFDDLAAHAGAMACDDVFLSLGTTIRDAGSEAAFRHVDYDLTLAAARAARDAGARRCLLVSSIGADAGSRFFYLRVKGEVEQAVTDLGFESVSVFRPGQLAGRRAVRRPGEVVALAAMALARPALVGPLRRYRPTNATVLARAMVATARRADPGRRLLEAEEIAGY